LGGGSGALSTVLLGAQGAKGPEGQRGGAEQGSGKKPLHPWFSVLYGFSLFVVFI
jgi:hypothetical protein